MAAGLRGDQSTAGRALLPFRPASHHQSQSQITGPGPGGAAAMSLRKRDGAYCYDKKNHQQPPPGRDHVPHSKTLKKPQAHITSTWSARTEQSLHFRRLFSLSPRAGRGAGWRNGPVQRGRGFGMTEANGRGDLRVKCRMIRRWNGAVRTEIERAIF